jgi:hypothetical protein
LEQAQEVLLHGCTGIPVQCFPALPLEGVMGEILMEIIHFFQGVGRMAVELVVEA